MVAVPHHALSKKWPENVRRKVYFIANIENVVYIVNDVYMGDGGMDKI